MRQSTVEVWEPLLTGFGIEDSTCCNAASSTPDAIAIPKGAVQFMLCMRSAYVTGIFNGLCLLLTRSPANPKAFRGSNACAGLCSKYFFDLQRAAEYFFNQPKVRLGICKQALAEEFLQIRG